MKPSHLKHHYTTPEAAKQLGITRAAVHHAIRQGRLNAEWGIIGPPRKGWRISEADLRNYEVSLLHQRVAKKTLKRLTHVYRLPSCPPIGIIPPA